MLWALLAFGLAAPALGAATPAARFDRLQQDDARVARVAYRLATANVAQCHGALAPQAGFVLHSIDQYGLADRRDAALSFALGDRVAVMAVVSGSPAARAGLATGDRLIAANGRDVGMIEASPTPTRASVERASRILGEEMASGAVSLRVSGPGGERTLRFAAETGCPSNVELIPDDAVNAWADGSRVMISAGLLQRCASDDDLALVIGHEMAHNLLHHRQQLAAEGVSANRLLPLTAAGSLAMRKTEEEADRLAVKLASGAKYELARAEEFLGGLLNRTVPAPASHPAPDRRLALLRSAIAEARGS